MYVCKKSIYIAHRRETSNVLMRSIPSIHPSMCLFTLLAENVHIMKITMLKNDSAKWTVYNLTLSNSMNDVDLGLFTSPWL